MSTLFLSVVTTITMSGTIVQEHKYPQQVTMTQQVHSMQQFPTQHQCETPAANKELERMKSEIEGTKVAKVISMGCIR